MTEKVKELRKLVPAPIGEALRLLKENDGDVEICVYLFKASCIKQIMEQTGCDEKMAAQHYETEGLDLNKAISSVRETLFDTNYTPIENITIENIKKVHQWLNMLEDKDFITSLDYRLLPDVILTFASLPTMKEVSEMVSRAKAIKDEYFEGYSDADSMEEFIRRNKLLDDNEEIFKINNAILLKITLIDKELSRHLRNLYKREIEG